jgi:hypothetical protein
MSEAVPLVNPMSPEMPIPLRARLDPRGIFSASVEDDSHLFAAPPGSLAFRQKKVIPDTVPPGGADDLAVVVGVPTDKRSGLVVAGTVLSPIEDPDLVARHAEELAYIAISVGGTATILATPDNAKDFFPLDFIAVDWNGDWGRYGTRGDSPEAGYPVPTFKKVEHDDPTAFAMVLQRGTSELRILLLGPRMDEP